MEVTESYRGVDAKELSLVPDLVLSHKFKMLEFEKYNGITCPEAHITMFCRRMAGYVNNDQLLIHCFQNSLAKVASKWYNQLNCSMIGLWRDLAQAFIKQYSQAPFITHMLGSSTKNFSDIVMNGEMIENAVRSGKIDVEESNK
nr:unnamed protein product [Gossypium raimondii]